MPLYDHFHPPFSNRRSWEGFHGQWPAMMVLQLNKILPSQFVAEPRIHLGAGSEYEVRIFDVKHNRRLVAAVEIVSPSNKDQHEGRQVFTAKCEALMQKGLSIAIVDLVTSKNFNLYANLLETLGQNDPTLGSEPPSIYAVACRQTLRGGKHFLETWSHVLHLEQSLPTLPIWLAETWPCRWTSKLVTKKRVAYCGLHERSQCDVLNAHSNLPLLLA